MEVRRECRYEPMSPQLKQEIEALPKEVWKEER
jgi:hypothetical protein